MCGQVPCLWSVSIVWADIFNGATVKMPVDKWADTAFISKPVWKRVASLTFRPSTRVL